MRLRNNLPAAAGGGGGAVRIHGKTPLGDDATTIGQPSNGDNDGDNKNNHKRRFRQNNTDRNPYAPPLPLILLVVWCVVQSCCNFQTLMKKNLGLVQQQQQQPQQQRKKRSSSVSATTTTTTAFLRSTTSGTGNIESNSSQVNMMSTTTATTTPSPPACPSLPDRLLHHHVDLLSPPLVPLTSKEVQQQKKLRKRDRLGTMGDSILLCPSHHRSRVDPNDGRIRTPENDPLLQSCRGIVKHYQSRSVYEHVKRCLTVLHDTGIAPRLLYSDDATLTLVEEDKGFLTMRNSPIPVDFDQQLRRILCILRQHSMVHRDVTYPNFIIDEVTGMIYIIDFGDAYLGPSQFSSNTVGTSSQQSTTISSSTTWNWRNIQNLFNIWWNNYDEEARLEEFIAKTIPEVRGTRQWRPPAHQWTSLTQNKMGALLLSKELLK